MSTTFAAARFGDEVILLNREQATMVLLEPDSAMAWAACDGRTIEELSLHLGQPHYHVRRIVRHLHGLGLVRLDDSGRWTRVPADQV